MRRLALAMLARALAHGVHNVWFQHVYPAFAKKGPLDPYFGGESGLFCAVVYGLLAGYGGAVNPQSDANFAPVNDADNWLHFGLAVGMIALGLLLGREAQPETRVPETTASAQ